MIVLINPNSTASMTDAMVQRARATVPGLRIEGWTSHDGPPAIQGAADGELATIPLLKLVQKAAEQRAAAIIIGCFDDTALDAARQTACCPVIGIGQAAYHMAVLAGPRFSVVTTMAVSVPVLEANIAAYGLAGSLSRVRASEVPVLDLERDRSGATARILDEIATAQKEDDVQSIVLGCGGMVTLAEDARATTGLKIIDGVEAAALAAMYLQA